MKLATFGPEHDALSAEVLAGREWEPVETAVVRDILERTPGVVLDFGAHVGWYSVLAGLLGHPVIAWEKDPEARRFLELNAKQNGVDVEICSEVNDDTPPVEGNAPVALMKVDLEGEECNAVRMCRDLFYARRIAYALIEVSPVFTEDGRSTCDYVTLVEHICESGYTAKRVSTGELLSDRYRRDFVRQCGQENILFERAP